MIHHCILLDHISFKSYSSVYVLWFYIWSQYKIQTEVFLCGISSCSRPPSYFDSVLGSQGGCGESGLPHWVWCRKQDFQVAASHSVTWQDRLSLVGVSPPDTSLSSSGWLLSPPGPPPCRGAEVEAVSEVEVDEVSRCSTSVWTADSAAPVSMWVLKSTIYGLLCCSDFLQSPVLIWTPCLI